MTYRIYRANDDSKTFVPDMEFTIFYDTKKECLAVIRELRQAQPKVKRKCIETDF